MRAAWSVLAGSSAEVGRERVCVGATYVTDLTVTLWPVDFRISHTNRIKNKTAEGRARRSQPPTTLR